MAPALKIHRCNGIHSQDNLYEEDDDQQQTYFYNITYVDKDLKLQTVQLCTMCNTLWIAANITLKQQEERKEPYYWSGELQDTLAALKDEKFKKTGVMRLGQYKYED